MFGNFWIWTFFGAIIVLGIVPFKYFWNPSGNTKIMLASICQISKTAQYSNITHGVGTNLARWPLSQAYFFDTSKISQGFSRGYNSRFCKYLKPLWEIRHTIARWANFQMSRCLWMSYILVANIITFSWLVTSENRPICPFPWPRS